MHIRRKEADQGPLTPAEDVSYSSPAGHTCITSGPKGAWLSRTWNHQRRQRKVLARLFFPIGLVARRLAPVGPETNSGPRSILPGAGRFLHESLSHSSAKALPGAQLASFSGASHVCLHIASSAQLGFTEPCCVMCPKGSSPCDPPRLVAGEKYGCSHDVLRDTKAHRMLCYYFIIAAHILDCVAENCSLGVYLVH